MTRPNQLYVNHDEHRYYCWPCDRDFSRHSNALSHCRSAQTHQGQWCERCEWLYVSSGALQSHLSNSSAHNHCDECSLDFDTCSELEDHEVGEHFLCVSCNEYFDDQMALDGHDVDVHNMCLECDELFNSRKELEWHKRNHLPADIPCLGCNRFYSEFSAMIVHLENGYCDSGTERRDIDDWIFDDAYMSRMYANRWRDQYRYKCPDCNNNFRYLSGLCQHVATRACYQHPDLTFHDVKKCIQRRI